MYLRNFSVLCFFLLVLCTPKSFAQNQLGKKGQLYFYWGYNNAQYTKSDIRFRGTDYDFTLHKVAAKDRQTTFDLETYFNPESFTIPQYNFRIGYFITNRWSLSFGSDHMKYVMQPSQKVKIDGYIRNSGTAYDGTYTGEEITLNTDFLQFEHTDGLNYINLAARYTYPLFNYKMFAVLVVGGVETGILLPKTNTSLLNKERHDAFHLSGYGLSTVAGLNFELYKYLFIQLEFKGGFVDMPGIRTSLSSTDKASQHFFFYQPNVVFGANIPLTKGKN